jgi:hypothetical protein
LKSNEALTSGWLKLAEIMLGVIGSVREIRNVQRSPASYPGSPIISLPRLRRGRPYLSIIGRNRILYKFQRSRLLQPAGSLSSDYGYNSSDAPRPLTSDCQYDSTDTPQPETSDNPTDTAWRYNPTYGPQVLTADGGYNPDMSHAQNYDLPDAPTYSTPPYSSENVSPPIESHEGGDDSNTGGHRRTGQSRGHTDNSKARKARRRH